MGGIWEGGEGWDESERWFSGNERDRSCKEEIVGVWDGARR